MMRKVLPIVAIGFLLGGCGNDKSKVVQQTNKVLANGTWKELCVNDSSSLLSTREYLEFNQTSRKMILERKTFDGLECKGQAIESDKYASIYRISYLRKDYRTYENFELMYTPISNNYALDYLLGVPIHKTNYTKFYIDEQSNLHVAIADEFHDGSSFEQMAEDFVHGVVYVKEK